MSLLKMLNGWEIVAIVSTLLILIGAKHLPEIARGLRLGLKEFKKSSREIDRALWGDDDDNDGGPLAA